MKWIDKRRTEQLQHDIHTQAVILVVVVAATVILCACLCLAVTPANYIAIIVINSVITIAGGWFVIHRLLAKVLPAIAERKLCVRVLALEKTSLYGIIDSVQEDVTVRKNIKADVVTLTDNPRKYYFVDGCPFSVGDRVSMSVADGYVCEAEVQNDK